MLWSYATFNANNKTLAGHLWSKTLPDADCYSDHKLLVVDFVVRFKSERVEINRYNYIHHSFKVIPQNQ